MAQDVEKVVVEEVFKECPKCGYKDGFHIMLERMKTDPEDKMLSIKMICPSCRQIYDAGLKLSM